MKINEKNEGKKCDRNQLLTLRSELYQIQCLDHIKCGYSLDCLIFLINLKDLII